MPPVLQLKHLSKHFGTLKAVDDLNFEVEQGSIFGFLGPNGSGKSTTLRMMMGLIHPDAGSILFFNESLKEHRRKIIGRIGCMIEKPDFYGYLTARENLSLFERYSDLSYTQKQYDELFDRVGLRGREHDKVKTYSHGMKQRLGLAQVLLHDPDMIILDEPNTGLDPQGIIDLRNLMFDLNRNHGKTILFSSHILSEVQELCTDMVVMNKGKKIVQGKVSELLSETELHVHIECDERMKLKQYLTESSWQLYIESFNEQGITLKMNKKEIAGLIKELVTANFSLRKVDYKNPLEEYFLEMTKSV